MHCYNDYVTIGQCYLEVLLDDLLRLLLSILLHQCSVAILMSASNNYRRHGSNPCSYVARALVLQCRWESFKIHNYCRDPTSLTEDQLKHINKVESAINLQSTVSWLDLAIYIPGLHPEIGARGGQSETFQNRGGQAFYFSLGGWEGDAVVWIEGGGDGLCLWLSVTY